MSTLGAHTVYLVVIVVGTRTVNLVVIVGSGWNRSPMLHKYKPAPVANSTSHNNTTLRKKKKKKLDKINLRCRKYHTLVIMPPNPPGMLILSFIYILLSLAYIFNSFSVFII